MTFIQCQIPLFGLQLNVILWKGTDFNENYSINIVSSKAFLFKVALSKTCRSAFLVAEVTSAFSIFRSHQSNLSSNIYQSHLTRFKWLFCFVFFHAGTAHYSPPVWIWRRVNYLYFFEYVYTSDTHNVASFPIRFLEGSYKFFSSILLVALTVMTSNKITYSLHFGQLHANQFT